jgi:hypothetical protein
MNLTILTWGVAGTFEPLNHKNAGEGQCGVVLYCMANDVPDRALVVTADYSERLQILDFELDKEHFFVHQHWPQG